VDSGGYKGHAIPARLITRARQLTAGPDELPRAGDVALAKRVVLGSTTGAALAPVHASVVLAGRLLGVGTVRPVLVHVLADALFGAGHVVCALLPTYQAVFCSRTAAVQVVLLADVVRSADSIRHLLAYSLLTVITLTYTV